jgi:subtilase family serine protease
VRTASATTRVCRQPDLRPDLVIEDVQVAAAPRADGLVRYTLLVGNEGRSPARGAVVVATLPGDAAPELHQRSVARLEPGGSALVKFVGPGCDAGQQPASFLADPSNAIDESDEANNGAVATCPTS